LLTSPTTSETCYYCELSAISVLLALDKPVTAIKALQRRGIASLRRKISDGTVSL